MKDLANALKSDYFSHTLLQFRVRYVNRTGLTYSLQLKEE